MNTIPRLIEETMNEGQLELKEVKFETIGGFVVSSAPFMDEDADLLAWTTAELTYPASAFSAAEVSTEEESAENREQLATTGCKRTYWENDGGQDQPQLKRPTPNIDKDAQLKIDIEEQKVKDSCLTNGSYETESHLPLWQNEELENVPNGFENGLTGLGNAYNMNGALLSPHSMTVFKQEGSGEVDGLQSSSDSNCTIQRLLQNTTTTASVRPDQDCRFQYVLAAATSIASKQGEETLTYLNQGQSYGIKLKKVGDLLAFKGKLLKSVIRLQFHERRLQYSEKEQILAWQSAHPGERIVECDVPLSFGLFDVEHDAAMLNTLSFCWDPTQEVGAYIKVNSISTEFTPKKHGGEKGVPFRIQVETYIQGDGFRLHAAACQIRVFKLKGADRKHKQEREKWLKLPESERSKYQPPFESTILSDVLPDIAFPAQPFVSSTTEPAINFRPGPAPRLNVPAARGAASSVSLPALPSVGNGSAKMDEGTGDAMAPLPPMFPPPTDSPPTYPPQADELTMDMGHEQVSTWLVSHGFEMLTNTLDHFSGSDLMRLSRQDLISICGLPHGLRLFYAIRSKPAVRLTIYVTLPGKTYYNAIYLRSTKLSELARKLMTLTNVTNSLTYELLMVGPNGIHILVTDELLSNVYNEAAFSLQVLQGDASGRCCFLLKSASTISA